MNEFQKKPPVKPHHSEHIEIACKNNEKKMVCDFLHFFFSLAQIHPLCHRQVKLTVENWRKCTQGARSKCVIFLSFSSAPYLSVAKLHLDRLTTVLYDREILCRAIGLNVSQLPLLACLLGNDVVPEECMQAIRNNAMAAYRCESGPLHLRFSSLKY